MLNFKSIILIGGLFLLGIQANAQCRSFVKNNCEEQLEDYLVSGRMYGGYASQGQEIDLVIVLNGGQKYRLINCSKENLGTIQVVLLDNKGNVIFDNFEHEFAQSWDFDVKATQEFTIRTIIPSPSKSQGTAVRDCNILIIGSKTAS